MDDWKRHRMSDEELEDLAQDRIKIWLREHEPEDTETQKKVKAIEKRRSYAPTA